MCDHKRAFARDAYGMRSDGPHRRRMHEAYVTHLEEIGARYLVVRGTDAEQLGDGIAAVPALLLQAQEALAA